MIDVTRLYCGLASPSNQLRYGRRSAADPSRAPRPVVVWNCTRACNLRCSHCYAHAQGGPSAHELDSEEGEAFLDDLAAFGCPVVLFSGGEPLVRPDLVRLVSHAVKRGLRPALSTNGTLLDPAMAQRLKDAGLKYVGISIDGDESAHNRLRGDAAAYRRTMAGLAAAAGAGLRVGLCHTLTRDSLPHIGHLFNLLENGGAQRVCFYHLVPSGRARKADRALQLTAEETRGAVDEILHRSADLVARGLVREILTVDNHADGVHIYLRLLQENPDRALDTLQLLSAAGGNRSGSAIACVGWDGTVHPDQFWRSRVLGTIRERPFSAIWSDSSHSLLSRLRNREGRIAGRCGRCLYFSLCRGNLRARAEAQDGDAWASDPGCYLSDDEILSGEVPAMAGHG